MNVGLLDLSQKNLFEKNQIFWEWFFLIYVNFILILCSFMSKKLLSKIKTQ